MKYLKKFYEDVETFKNTDEDIQMFFTDYTDEDPNSLSIENVLINTKDKRIISETPYIKDISKFRRAKKITLNIGKADGIITRSGTCLTSFDILKETVADIERFYALSGEEVNYTINMEYDELVITFITLGDSIKPEESHVTNIDKYLLELKTILKNMKYHRVSNKGNWLEVRTPSKGDNSYYLSNLLSKIKRDEITLENTDEGNASKGKIELIKWKNKTWEDGYQMKLSGGDNQVIVQLFLRDA